MLGEKVGGEGEGQGYSLADSVNLNLDIRLSDSLVNCADFNQTKKRSLSDLKKESEVREEDSDDDSYRESDDCEDRDKEEDDADGQCEIEFTEMTKEELEGESTELATVTKEEDRHMFACDIEGCDRKYTKKSHLVRHQQTFHQKIKRYECEVCGYKFTTNQHLKRHLATHATKKPFICDFEGCNEAFAKNNQLKRHKCVHTGALPYPCTVCDAAFQYPSQLKRHTLSHSNLKMHACGAKNCGATFDSYLALMKHMKQEHPQKLSTKDLTCNICGKVLSNQKNMKNHMKTHENQRELFVCEYPGCQKVFTKKTNLRAHEKAKHEESPKFTCEICSKEFAHKHVLQRHQKTHLETKEPKKKKVKTLTEEIAGEELRPSAPSTTTNYSIFSMPGDGTEVSTLRDHCLMESSSSEAIVH